MRKLSILILTVLCTSVFAESFNEYGIWQAIDNVVLSAGQRRSFGPVSVSGRESEINTHVYGVTGNGDSLKINLVIYGMMNYALADTVHRKELATTGTTSISGTTTTLADTLSGVESFPYVFGTIQNKDTNNNVTVDVWLYSVPSERTIVRLR